MESTEKFMSLANKWCFVIVAIILAFAMGRETAPKAVIRQGKERVDTLLIRDTIAQEKPIYRTNFVRDTIVIYIHDTIPVYLPREVKVYEDSAYRAEVSGVFPSLDKIEVYQRTQVVTKEIERDVYIPVRQRWGIGIQAGYGAHLYGASVCLSPYIGVGVTYNIISW